MPRLALAAILSLPALGVGLPFLGTQTEWALEKCANGAPEATQPSVEGWSWWPLGTRCRLSRAGEVVATAVVPPWRGDPWVDQR
jgi:hypothetical protein